MRNHKLPLFRVWAGASLLLVLILILSPTLPAFAKDQAKKDNEKFIEVIVTHKNGKAHAKQTAQKYGGEVTHELGLIGGVAVRMPEAALNGLLKAKGLDVQVFPNAPVFANLSGDDPMQTAGVTLVREAEKATLYGNFTVSSDGSYIHTPQGSGQFYNGAISDHRAQFTFYVPTAGNYVVQGWISAVDGGSDSFYVQMDNGSVETWHTGIYSSFTQVSFGNYSLAAGTHTLTLYQREDGTQLDKLALVCEACESIGAGVEPTEATHTLIDYFDTSSYSNNDGTKNWNTDWFEMGDDGSPSGWDITVEYDSYCPNSGGRCVEFDADAGLNASLERGFDLEGTSTATLSFDYSINHNGATTI